MQGGIYLCEALYLNLAKTTFVYVALEGKKNCKFPLDKKSFLGNKLCMFTFVISHCI